MLLWLVLLNAVLSIMNGVYGVDNQNLFAIWASGFNAAGAFAILMLWFFECKQGR